jgi:hypothetical protein
MTTLTQKITVPSNRRVKFEIALPEEVPPGEAEVRLEISSFGLRGRRQDPSRWFGSLAGCPALAGDLCELQRKMRDEWPD